MPHTMTVRYLLCYSACNFIGFAPDFWAAYCFVMECQLKQWNRPGLGYWKDAVFILKDWWTVMMWKPYLKRHYDFIQDKNKKQGDI